MNEKCNKYEAYFTFASKEDFEKHIFECPECQRKKAEEDKLSFLIKDSKEEYIQMKNKQKRLNLVKKAVCIFSFFIFFGTYSCFELQSKIHTSIYKNSDAEISIIAKEGLPTDEFGFFAYE